MQLKTATHLYLSHTEERDSARDEKVMDVVSQLNPHSAWVQLDTFTSELIQLSAAAPKLPPRVLRCIDERALAHDHEYHSATHHFASMEVALSDGLERAQLEVFLLALPPEVIRAKGLIRLADQQYGYTVFDYLGADRHVELRRYDAAPRVSSLFIAIGTNLPQATIQVSLQRMSQAAVLSA